jgi:hypothetical protein
MLHAVGKVLRIVAVPLLAFLALGAWAFSSPVGSSPDEDYHLTSAWCGQGLESGVCEEGPAADQRAVPESLLHAAKCYAFKPEESAACQWWWFLDESQELIPTERGNFTGDYPPAFYYTMNFLVGEDISRSVVAMRLVNGALFVGLMTATYWLLPRHRRAMAVLGTAVTLVPLSVYLLPSINPSSWAVASIAVVFPALVGFFETTGRRRVGLGLLAALGTLIGAGSRADSAVYIAIAAVLAVVVSARWRRGGWRFVALPLLIGAACAASYLSSGQSGAASTALESDQPYTVVQQLGYNLLNVPTLWAGVFGTWGLGWLDTLVPSIVWVVNLAVFGGILFLGIRRTTPAKTIAILVALVAAWLMPTWVLLQTEDLVGVGVQPRYLLPLLVLLAQVALLGVTVRGNGISRSQLLIVVAALTATNAISLHYNIRRYVTGTDVFRFDLDAHREWWWDIPISPMVVWIGGSIAFGAALFLAARALLAGAEEGEGPEGHGPAGDRLAADRADDDRADDDRADDDRAEHDRAEHGDLVAGSEGQDDDTQPGVRSRGPGAPRHESALARAGAPGRTPARPADPLRAWDTLPNGRPAHSQGERRTYGHADRGLG